MVSEVEVDEAPRRLITCTNYAPALGRLHAERNPMREEAHFNFAYSDGASLDYVHPTSTTQLRSPRTKLRASQFTKTVGQ
jgi:hypothetical protein